MLEHALLHVEKHFESRWGAEKMERLTSTIKHIEMGSYCMGRVGWRGMSDDAEMCVCV